MTAAGIYCRISRDRKGSGLGVERQEVACRDLARAKGWDVEEVYVDNDVSATANKPRAEYERMKGDVQRGRLGAVVCWNTDRLTRKPRELEDWIDFADQHDLQLASVTGQMDLSTGAGRTVARLLGAIAKQEVEQTSLRARAAHQQAAQQGKAHSGGHRPYGFAADRVTHDTLESAVIRESAEWLLDGATLVEACRRLNQRGDATSLGRPWTSNSLRKILISPRVAGYREYGGELFGAVWSPILGEDTWHQLRGHLTAPERRVSTTSSRRYTWTGLLRCGRCGYRLGPRQIAGRASYACRAGSRISGCGGLAVRREPVDALLNEVLLRRIEQVHLDPDGDDPLHEEVIRLSSEVAQHEDRLRDVAETYALGGLGLETYRVTTLAVERALSRSREALRVASSRRQYRKAHALDAGEVRKAWPELRPTERHVLARVFVERVIVMPAPVRGRNKFDPSRVKVVWS